MINYLLSKSLLTTNLPTIKAPWLEACTWRTSDMIIPYWCQCLRSVIPPGSVQQPLTLSQPLGQSPGQHISVSVLHQCWVRWWNCLRSFFLCALRIKAHRWTSWPPRLSICAPSFFLTGSCRISCTFILCTGTTSSFLSYNFQPSVFILLVTWGQPDDVD